MVAFNNRLVENQVSFLEEEPTMYEGKRGAKLGTCFTEFDAQNKTTIKIQIFRILSTIKV
jgi:hypothetical protein